MCLEWLKAQDFQHTKTLEPILLNIWNWGWGETDDNTLDSSVEGVPRNSFTDYIIIFIVTLRYIIEFFQQLNES